MLQGGSLRHVLRQAIRDILQRPSLPARVVTTLTDLLRPNTSFTKLYTFGPTAQWSAFYHRLTTNGCQIQTISGLGCDLRQDKIERRSNKVKDSRQEHQEEYEDDDEDNLIAITGYSGRFPGAENVDELWQVLCEGRDTSTQVCVRNEGFVTLLADEFSRRHRIESPERTLRQCQLDVSLIEQATSTGNSSTCPVELLCRQTRRSAFCY